MTIASSPRLDRKRRRAWSAVVLASGLIVVLAGCARKVEPFETTGAVPDDYRLNHPIAIEEMVETLDVPVGLYTAKLNFGARGNVAGFAQKFVDSGSSVIAVVAPSGSPNQENATGIAVEIEDVLRLSGVAEGAIDYRVYQAGSGERNAPVRVAFSRVAAHTAPCEPWRDQVTVNGQNRNYVNFGCATQQNLAAITANPLDLLYPRGLTPADAARRADVLNKYRKGAAFSADLSKEEGGNVAQGVGN
ncbi:MAG: CpaD family pilus assembly protein [Bauldia sp.]